MRCATGYSWLFAVIVWSVESGRRGMCTLFELKFCCVWFIPEAAVEEPSMLWFTCSPLFAWPPLESIGFVVAVWICLLPRGFAPASCLPASEFLLASGFDFSMLFTTILRADLLFEAGSASFLVEDFVSLSIDFFAFRYGESDEAFLIFWTVCSLGILAVDACSTSSPRPLDRVCSFS